MSTASLLLLPLLLPPLLLPAMPIYLNVPARADGFWLSHIAEEAAALSLRSQVASYMEANWDVFPTVLPGERAVRLKGVRGRAWAGEEELLALSKVSKDATPHA